MTLHFRCELSMVIASVCFRGVHSFFASMRSVAARGVPRSISGERCADLFHLSMFQNGVGAPDSLPIFVLWLGNHNQPNNDWNSAEI